MTVSTTTRKAGPFIGNGATVAFPFVFKVFSESDLAVILTDAAGAETTLTLNADYSVALNADQDNDPGGVVTYSYGGIPLPSTQKLTILSSVPLLQPTDIQNRSGFYPSVIEDALDRVTILAQQAEELLSRAIRFPVSDSATNAELPTVDARAGKAIVFDEDGNIDVSDAGWQVEVTHGNVIRTTHVKDVDFVAGGTTLSLPSDGFIKENVHILYSAGEASAELQQTAFSLAGATITLNTPIPSDVTQIETWYIQPLAVGSINDGAVTDAKVAADAAIDANKLSFVAAGAGAVARTVRDVLRDAVNVKNFGAAGDGVTDDTAAIQAALDYSYAPTVGKAVYLPPGQYLVNGTLIINSKVALVGDSSGTVRIKQSAAGVTLLKSYNFDALTGTNNAGGVRRALLKGITFEASMSGGGVPAGTTSQHGIQMYGYGCVFEDVHVRNFGGIGLYTEWATPGTAPDSGYDDGFVENRYNGLKIYQCGLAGMKINGPHDGQWGLVVCFSNNMNDVSADEPNVHITSRGNPQYIDQLHAWGNTSGVALLAEGSVKLTNCALEGATQTQLRIKTGECEVLGGEIFAAGSSSSKGIEFVGGTGVCIGYKIDTVIRGCNGGSVDFGTGVDSAEVKARIFQTSGTPIIGTIPTAGVGNSLNLTVGGGADNRQTKIKHYHATFTNWSLVGSTSEGLEYADHGGEGVYAMPQRKTEPAAGYTPASGHVGCARVNAHKIWQSSGHVGAIMGEPAAAVTPADNLDFSNYQLVALAAAGAPVTINNFTNGLNGSLMCLLMPTGGSEITLSTTGNIRSKTGANITRTGLGSNRLIGFFKARDGNYYQL